MASIDLISEIIEINNCPLIYLEFSSRNVEETVHVSRPRTGMIHIYLGPAGSFICFVFNGHVHSHVIVFLVRQKRARSALHSF